MKYRFKINLIIGTHVDIVHEKDGDAIVELISNYNEDPSNPWQDQSSVLNLNPFVHQVTEDDEGKEENYG